MVDINLPPTRVFWEILDLRATVPIFGIICIYIRHYVTGGLFEKFVSVYVGIKDKGKHYPKRYITCSPIIAITSIFWKYTFKSQSALISFVLVTTDIYI